MAKRIYFAGSIRAGRDDAPLYAKIVDILRRHGTVLTEHVGNPNLREDGEKTLSDKEIHDRDIKWLKEADVLVAEVTQPSLGVGYEIGRAVLMEKRVLCLFRPHSGRRLSAMIRGVHDGNTITVIDYSEEKVESILQEFFSK